jgi:hypothetical protein
MNMHFTHSCSRHTMREGLGLFIVTIGAVILGTGALF